MIIEDIFMVINYTKINLPSIITILI